MFLRQKHKSSTFYRAMTFGALTLGVSMIPFAQVFALDDNALPSGGNVVGGSASFDYNTPNHLDVYQGTDRAVIEWNSFNIGANASTQFHQPNSSSVVVNRIIGGGDPTQILGTLRANGTVFVLDTNGVIFGNNSVVDVGSVVIGTGTIDDGSFMSGSGTIDIINGNPDAEIINNGSITVAEAGLAAFVSPNITNNGIIQAKLGRVALAAGEKVTVDLYGDDLVEVATDMPLDHASIKNTGTISAEGGVVLMTANAAKNIVDAVINTSGIVDVSSAVEKGGKIILEGANAIVSGTLNASGKTGGGKINVGGDYQGSGTIKRGDYTYITGSAVLKASTTGTDGDGGTIIVWADNSTQFDGLIEAKGGSLSGNGGLVETSGKINLGITGWVDASAPYGNAGEWLLDPSNVTIDDGGGVNIPVGGGTIDPASDSYVINDASIEAALNAGNNVTITTVNGAGTEDGNIVTSGAVSINKTSGASATLTLKAAKNISVSSTTITSSGAGGALNVILWADSDGNNVGKISTSNLTVDTNNGEFFAGGGLDDGHDITDGFGDVAYNGTAADGRPDYYATADSGPGMNINSTTIQTGTGNITVMGQGGSAAIDGQDGVDLGNTTLETTSGNILVLGQGGGDGAHDNNFGIAPAGTTTLRSTTGSVTMNGTGGNGNWNSSGVYTGAAFTLESNSGAINLFGAGGTATGANYGMYTQHTNIVSTGNSTITVKGKRNGAGGGAEDINLDVDGTVGGAGATGNINFIADSFSTLLDIETTGNVTIKPRTATTTIAVGDGATGDLNLSQNDLFNIIAAKLIIGDSVLGTGDVEIRTWDLTGKTFNTEIYGNDMSFTGSLDIAGKDFLVHAKDNGGDFGEVIFDNPSITKTSGGDATMTFKSDGRTYTNQTSSINATVGKLNLIFWSDADNDHTGNGHIDFQAPMIITSNGGDVFMGGGLDDGHDITDSFGTVVYNGTASDGRPDYYAESQSRPGVNLADGGVSSGVGNITMLGMGGNSTDYQIGVRINNSSLQTTDGNITLIGLGGNDVGATHQNYWGIAYENSVISISGTGGVTMNGTGGTSSDNNHGIYADASPIDVVDGAVNITGKGGTGAATNYGVVWINTDIVSSGASATTFKGQSGDATSKGLYIRNGTDVGGGSATGNQTYIGDTLDLDFNTNTTGSVLFKPLTASSSIGLGGGTGDFSLTDAQLSQIIAGTLIIGDSSLGTGDFDINTWDLSAQTHNVQLHGKNFDIGGLTTGAGSVAAYAKTGSITISADGISNDVGDLNLLSTHNIDVNGAVTNTGTGLINMFAGWDGTSAITTPALFNRDNVDLGATARDLTIGTNGSVSSAGANTAVILAATKKFINSATAGMNAVSAAGGRFLVYSENPTDTVKGGITANSVYSKAYNANPAGGIAGTDSLFVFSAADPAGGGGGGGGSSGGSSSSISVNDMVSKSMPVSQPVIDTGFESNTGVTVDANGEEVDADDDTVILSSSKSKAKKDDTAGCLLTAGSGGCIIH